MVRIKISHYPLLRRKNGGWMILVIIALANLTLSPSIAQTEAGIHPSFRIFNAKPSSFAPTGGFGGADFMDDGRLVVCSWGEVNLKEGKLFIMDNPEAQNPETISVTEIASGIEEPMGIRVVNDDIYLMEKMALTKYSLSSSETWERTIVAEGWSQKEDSWSHSLEYLDGSFYTMINAWNIFDDPYHGCWLKMDLNGDIECLAGGTRSANGTALGPNGSMFTTDQQGNWLPANKLIHLKPGNFYGFNQNSGDLFYSEPITPPTAWIPYSPFISQSPSDPLLVTEGLFIDQLLIGDVTSGYIRRYFLDEVDGEYQAAIFKFCDGIANGNGIQSGVNRLRWAPGGDLFLFGIGNHGLGGAGNWRWQAGTNDGLQKLVFQNDTTFEMLKLRSRTGGLEIEFTKPVKPGLSPSDFVVKTWNYIPTSIYGGPISNLKDLSVSNVVYSEDNRQIFLSIQGMVEEYVIHIKTSNLLSDNNETLWGDEVWYTQNKFGTSEPFSVPVVTTKNTEKNPYDFIQTSNGIHLNVPTPVKYSIFNLKGKVISKDVTSPINSGSAFISTTGLAHGVYMVNIVEPRKNVTIKMVVDNF